MPLAGTGDILGGEMMAAVDAVAAEILASLTGPTGMRPPTAAEMASNRRAIYNALGRAIVAHVIANAIVTGSATGSPPTMPVLGNII